METWKIDEALDLPLAIIEDTEDGEGVVEIGERNPRNLEIAAHIVRCVNSFDSLVAALETLLRDEKLDDDDPRLIATRIQAQSALKKAKE